MYQQNQLVDAQSPDGQQHTFTYAPNHSLVAKQTGANIITYLRDDQHNALTTLDKTTGIYTDSLYLNGQTVARITNVNGTDTTHYIHTDLAMNPIMATDAQQKIIWQKDYDPYGNEGQVSGDTSNLTFHHNEYMTETGLVYIGARWYSPQLRRFVSPDPVGVPEAAIVGVNRFHYGLDNPLSYQDPDGEFAIPLLYAAAAVAVVAMVAYEGWWSGHVALGPSPGVEFPTFFNHDSNESTGDKPQIKRKKQDEHIKGTPGNKNRTKQDPQNPPSTWDDPEEADDLTIEAWENGTIVPEKPNTKIYEVGRRVGTSGDGTKGHSGVKAHIDSKGRIHGHPWGTDNSSY